MKKILFLTLFVMFSFSLYAEINMYGPGGPHTALIEMGKKYEEKTGVKVNVNFGPQATWNDKAKKNADILFGASEQSAIAIVNDHKDRFSVYDIEPIYLRRAIILVKKGNPKQIKGIKDLAKKDVKVIVPDGMGKSNTSGTGVWEDVAGRTKDIELVRSLRSKIVLFTPNSGTARNAFLNNEADAWITWIDWAKSNPGYGDVIEIEKDYVIYRDINVTAVKNAKKEVKDFIKFLRSNEAKNIAKKYGWM